MVTEPTAASSPSRSEPFDDDAQELRREILRLRDAALGREARIEVLTDRVSTLESELRDLDTHAQSLQRRIDRSPVQLARRLLRRLRRLATVG